MDNYTKVMEQKAYEAAIEYYPKEKILEAVNTFHKFSDSLDDFLRNHGYAGDINDITGKTDFIKRSFEKSGIPVPRGIREWYTKGKGISRTTAFQICFAFRLDKVETDDFFRRVMMTKSFDCHAMEEAVYYYCICNGKDYAEADQLLQASPLNQIPDITKSRMVFDGDILFTSSIMKEIDQFKSGEELLTYFKKNVEKFGYNHVTATDGIQKLWREIRNKEKGLADKEKIRIQGCIIKTGEERSVSEILRQIMGLDEVEVVEKRVENKENLEKENKSLFVLKSDRSIKPLLENNPLLPEIAEKQFPNRQTLEKILKGKHVEQESIRKTMILTYFYYFWIKKALQEEKKQIENNGNNTPMIKQLNMMAYQAAPGDDGRFIDNMNSRLLEVGYPELYPGNPYDWIFVYCSMSEEPLTVFREFIHEMYLENESDIIKMNEKQNSKS